MIANGCGWCLQIPCNDCYGYQWSCMLSMQANADRWFSAVNKFVKVGVWYIKASNTVNCKAAQTVTGCEFATDIRQLCVMTSTHDLLQLLCTVYDTVVRNGQRQHLWGKASQDLCHIIYSKVFKLVRHTVHSWDVDGHQSTQHDLQQGVCLPCTSFAVDFACSTCKDKLSGTAQPPPACALYCVWSNTTKCNTLHFLVPHSFETWGLEPATSGMTETWCNREQNDTACHTKKTQISWVWD